MTLEPQEVKRFYRIFMPLIMFVNSRQKLVPNLKTWDLDHPIDPPEALLLRNALWANMQILDEFVEQNPARLDGKDLAIAQSWRRALMQSYFVVKHLKRHSIFSAKGEHYAVVGLNTAFEELIPVTPTVVTTALIPFEGRIIYDSLLSSAGPRITFGPGVRRRCNEEYQAARRAGLVIQSLEV